MSNLYKTISTNGITKCLKRLYHCNAYCDCFTLVSYETPVIHVGKRFIYVDYWNETNTTKQHIRKYIKWLETVHEYTLAHTLRVIIDKSREHKSASVIYCSTCNSVYALSICPQLCDL